MCRARKLFPPAFIHKHVGKHKGLAQLLLVRDGELLVSMNEFVRVTSKCNYYFFFFDASNVICSSYMFYKEHNLNGV